MTATPSAQYPAIEVVPRTAALPLLGIATSLALAATAVWPLVFPASTIPGIVLVGLGLLGIRLVWTLPGITRRRWRGCLWANLVLGGIGIWLSPLFGLYLFINYPEAARALRGAELAAHYALTALALSVAQSGGVRSAIFLPPMVAAFWVVNVGIATLMYALERRRDRLYTQLRQAHQELIEAQRHEAMLVDQLVDQARQTGMMEERSRLSREIHDTVAQDLVAIITQLDAASDAVDAGERDRRLTMAAGAARGALAEARRAVAALSSPRLDDNDLALAVDDLLGGWRKSTGLTAELSVAGPVTASSCDDALLRVAQEALANVARHAHASRVDVRLAYAPDRIELRISDDGVGFDATRTPAGRGRASMSERIAAFGGTLDLHSVVGRGTTVTAVVPSRGESR